jgi:adenylate kinase
MAGDREVIGLLLEELLKPQYHDGVIVDGFPAHHRAGRMLENVLPRDARTPQRVPLDAACALFSQADVSHRAVVRQRRGQRAAADQARQRETRAQSPSRRTGVGKPVEVRVTDLDPELCRNRYRTFKETTFDALQSLQRLFHFHFIDAEGNLKEVQQNILREFTYQSTLELNQETFEIIRNIPVASQLTLHARQELVERLERYEEDAKPLFQRVVKIHRRQDDSDHSGSLNLGPRAD